MAYENVAMAYSPLSNRVYVGRRKAMAGGYMSLSSKQDRTSNFIETMIQYIEPGHQVEVTRLSDGKRFRFVCEEIDAIEQESEAKEAA